MEHLFAMLNSIHEMTQNLQDYLSTVLKNQCLEKKSFILKAGHICRRVCYLETGLVRCFYQIGDNDISSWFMKEGDIFFAVESFLTQRPSHESVQALENSTLYYLEYDQLQYVYRNFPEFNFIGRILIEKSYVMSERRVQFLRIRQSDVRYKHLTSHQPELIQRVPAKYLATYLGITEVTLSKVKATSRRQSKS